jgi:mono/diheme cytochrome c family protein
MRVFTGIAAAALVGLFSTPAFAQDTKLVQRGEQLYGEHKCSMCHSVAGKGNKAGALDDVGTRLSEEEIRQWMINPRVMAEKTKATRKPLMPAYTKLSKEDLEAVIAYMRSLKGPAKK